jgi:indole-3-glycerol phosphate synthase
MSSFLDKILKSRRRDIAVCKERISSAEIQHLAAQRSDFRGFAQALDTPGVRIIAEIKRASPSKGDINPRLDPAHLARLYERGGAAAISVLTEPAFFKGSENDLNAARGVATLPVLRKDFIIDPYQIYESVAMGADAILLIVRILDDETLHSLHTLARRIGLDVMTEVFDEDDARRAGELKADLIGINNRDLARFTTDLEQTVRLAAHFPAQTALVAASGIHQCADIQKNLHHGIRRFLIGEALVKHHDSAAVLREWTQQGIS